MAALMAASAGNSAERWVACSAALMADGSAGVKVAMLVHGWVGQLVVCSVVVLVDWMAALRAGRAGLWAALTVGLMVDG